jgi:hypothetical protein
LDAVRTVIYPGAARLDELAGRDHRSMANHGNEIALASRLDPQHAEAILGIVERDAIDQAGQDLGWRAHPGWRHHRRKMNPKIRASYRHRASSSMPSQGLTTSAMRQRKGDPMRRSGGRSLHRVSVGMISSQRC